MICYIVSTRNYSNSNVDKLEASKRLEDGGTSLNFALDDKVKM